MEPISRRTLFTAACGVAALGLTGMPVASASAVK